VVGLFDGVLGDGVLDDVVEVDVISLPALLVNTPHPTPQR
jgi:hypothetical protein